MKELAVIVKFDDNKYSFKTKSKCFWCKMQYYKSTEDLKENNDFLYYNEIFVKPKGNQIDKEGNFLSAYYEWVKLTDKINRILNNVNNINNINNV